MPRQLDYTVELDGISFFLGLDTKRLPIDTWALKCQELPVDVQQAVPILLGLREAECVQESEDGILTVPHETIASLDRDSIESLGLPQDFEGILSIEGSGLITDPDFEILYQLRSPEGRPYYIDKQIGTIIEIGRTKFTIRDPIYSILKNIREFNSSDHSSQTQNLRSWAALKRLFPDEIVVDDYLQTVNVALCSAFTLKERPDEQGDITFDPIPIQKKNLLAKNPLADDTEDDLVENDELTPVLPPDLENSFGERFRRFGSAKASYALQDGWLIVVDDVALPALNAVRRAQKASPEERRAFTENPYAGIRELSGDVYDDDSLDIIFSELKEFGSRVEAVGKFVPTVLPYVKHAGDTWLPPESIGFSIGGKLVAVSKEDALELVEKLRGARQSGEQWISHNQVDIPVNDESIRAADTLIEAINRFKPGEKTEKPASRELEHALLLGANANLEDLSFSAPEIKPRPADKFIPKALKSSLKPHQKSGLVWLQNHWRQGSPGALLADDMGLGKTIQSLAFVCWIREMNARRSKATKPVLIVAPTGLLKNWMDEYEKHFDIDGLGTPLQVFGSGLRAIKTQTGSGRASELAVGTCLLDTDKLATCRWALTTYETLRDYSHSFGCVRWEVIIFDEAQKIKNPSVLISEQARAVASNAEFVLAMTGTPVENRVTDLWSIADTCHSGLLGDLRTFIRTYEGELDAVKDKLLELQQMVLHESDESPKLMLRRMKGTHLKGLPTRNDDRIIATDMPARQRDAYHNAVNKARFSDDRKGKMLEVLHSIRTISLHPGLISGKHMSDEEFINDSARLIGAFRALDKIHEGKDKALIFIESRAIQPTLQGILQRRYNLPKPPLIINGAVSGFRRKALVDEFQNQGGFGVMLLSPKAGGVGLTLSAANHVIHLSRWWNPAVEDQCTDRVYRIGQEKDVHVVLPMAVFNEKPSTSFDEKLHDLLVSKRALSRTVLAPLTHTPEEIQNLYNDVLEHVEKP